MTDLNRPHTALDPDQFPELMRALRENPGLRSEIDAIMYACTSQGLYSAADHVRAEGAIFLALTLSKCAEGMNKLAHGSVAWKPGVAN